MILHPLGSDRKQSVLFGYVSFVGKRVTLFCARVSQVLSAEHDDRTSYTLS
jgi:hypothetical protein